eukprot:CAMPEP_0117073602 /NCGR_PEP_ID=MMETSP0472-20121206/51830_1 /TAXON_ID=693140 ORGANISM="Tiarina fusus, Strain LIS" /NCGR_SAMPLE_ID=MMETSP0472 /ASSEMBLY_ACC=CAM_ASM_000603 /LENGTH=207 /DNA_ID=CAMNT_0004798231 /DNA_START=128 /DNA_END=751 /DNA_ORIENTATION=+
MSLDDDNHASGHQKLAGRLSMDREVHDQPDLSETVLTDDVGESSHSAFDDDEDSFCAASDDCAPDKEFLDAILEEYHPERVNLLDQSFPEPLTKPKQEAVSHERRLTRSKEEGSIRFGRTLKMEPTSDEKEKENTKQTSDHPEEPATNGTTAMDVDSTENTETPEQTSENHEAEEAESGDTLCRQEERNAQPWIKQPKTRRKNRSDP